MPLPLAVTCFSKSQIGFTFLVLAYPGSPGQRAVKRACVCVRARMKQQKHVQVNTLNLMRNYQSPHHAPRANSRTTVRQSNVTFLLGAYFDGRPAEGRLSELVDCGDTEAVGGVGSQALDQRTLVDTVRRRRPALVACAQ